MKTPKCVFNYSQKGRYLLAIGLVALGVLLQSRITQADNQPVRPLRKWEYEVVLDALHDPVRDCRDAAFLWLNRNAEPDQPGRVPNDLLSHVADQLQSSDFTIKKLAINTLGRLGLAGGKYAAEVTTLLDHPDQEIQLEVLEALGLMGSAGANHAIKVAKLLNSSSRRVQTEALDCLVKMGEAGVTHPDEVFALLEGADYEDHKTVKVALKAINMMVSDQAVFADKAIAYLETTHPEWWERGIEALAVIDNFTLNHVDKVITLWDKENQKFRNRAILALGAMGTAGAVHSKKVASLLESKDPEDQLLAHRTLAKMGREGAVYADKVARLLESDNSQDRAAVIITLGKMCAHGANQADTILDLLKNPKDDHELNAVFSALALMGETDPTIASKVASLLQSTNDYMQVVAVIKALGEMGTAGATQAEKVANLLQTSNEWIIYPALSTLLKMGKDGAAHVEKITDLLQSSEEEIQFAALGTLLEMGKKGWDTHKGTYAAKVVDLLPSSDLFLQLGVLVFLEELGEAGEQYATKVAYLLDDPSLDIKQAAALALGKMGKRGREYAAKVAERLNDLDNDNIELIGEALGGMGEEGVKHAAEVAAFVSSTHPTIQYSAIKALGKMNKSGSIVEEMVASFLLHRNKIVAEEATNILLKRGSSDSPPAKSRALLISLNAHLLNHFGDTRLICYLLGPLTKQEKTMINWVGNREGNNFSDPKSLKIEEVRLILGDFVNIWPQLSNTPNLRKAVADQVDQLTYTHVQEFTTSNLLFSARDVNELQLWVERLDDGEHTSQASAIRELLGKIELYAKIRTGLLGAFGHMALWCLLIWGYPRFPLVQSLFFWNPWVRRFVGLGYVGFLITVIPALRQRMFKPFRSSLLPKGSLIGFDQETYFPDSEVSAKAVRRKGGRLALSAALPVIRGQVVLEGASGLGKTILLVKLVQQSRRIAVLLRATECNKGPLAAIQSRLQGEIRDEKYLRALIHAGAIDVAIDGLNEATPNTRAAIVHFVEESFRGNFILTTQPMEWEAPRTAEVWVLHPLRREQIVDFLVKQWEAVKGDTIYQDDKVVFEQAVETYMTEILACGEDDERFQVLSNPMEAKLVAELIAKGEQPDLLKLFETLFEKMSEDFEKVHNRPFPRDRFAEQVYAWRCSDKLYFPTDNCEAEVAALVAHKVMIERESEVKSEKDTSTLRRWWFRHDKFMEFYLLPAFEKNHDGCREKHWQDEQYYGVYDLLALSLKDEEEGRFFAFLVEMAANHKRNDLLNRYTIARRARLRKKELSSKA